MCTTADSKSISPMHCGSNSSDHYYFIIGNSLCLRDRFHREFRVYTSTPEGDSLGRQLLCRLSIMQCNSNGYYIVIRNSGVTSLAPGLIRFYFTDLSNGNSAQVTCQFRRSSIQETCSRVHLVPGFPSPLRFLHQSATPSQFELSVRMEARRLAQRESVQLLQTLYR